MKKTADGSHMLADVAGHGHKFLAFRVGPARCGAITDGVSFAHWKIEEPLSWADYEGSWVIPFADLEAIYLAAKEARRGVTYLTEASDCEKPPTSETL